VRVPDEIVALRAALKSLMHTLERQQERLGSEDYNEELVDELVHDVEEIKERLALHDAKTLPSSQVRDQKKA